MLRSVEKMIGSDFNNHLIRDKDLAILFGGSDASRYGIVNKALKSKELIRLNPGCYILSPKYLDQPMSQFYLANRMVANSYITAESALGFYGWIPERIVQTTSACAFGRKREYKTSVGVFTYLVPPVLPQCFYHGVKMIELNKKTVLIASPLRALVDYIYWHRVTDANIDWLENSM